MPHVFTRLMFILLVFALLTACGSAPTAQPSAAPLAATANSAPTDAPAAIAGSYPLTIENCGRTLTFTQAPERVLAIYQPLAEIMIALGLGEKIVGIQYGQSQEPLPEQAEAFLFSTFMELPASQNERSVGVNCAASGIGLRLPEAVEVMARAFHPDAFSAAPATETATYPVTIENCGNTPTFTQAPERIAPLYPPVTEMLLLLGLEERIVGIGGSGTEPVLTDLQASYVALPKLADSSAIPREVLLAAEPDLVMDNQPDYFYDASQGFATREEIAAAGAQIYTLSAKCDGGKLDATMEDVYTDLRNLGAIFGVLLARMLYPDRFE